NCRRLLWIRFARPASIWPSIGCLSTLYSCISMQNHYSGEALYDSLILLKPQEAMAGQESCPGFLPKEVARATSLKKEKVNSRYFMAGILLSAAMTTHASEESGAVDTAWKLLGANHKIVIEVFDDPLVAGVSCYISRAKTGGIKGSLGLAEDRAEASVACRQVGTITFKEAIPRQAEVFTERTSILF